MLLGKQIHEFGSDGQQVYKVFAQKLKGMKEHFYTINRYSDDGELLETFILNDGEVTTGDEEDD